MPNINLNAGGIVGALVCGGALAGLLFLVFGADERLPKGIAMALVFGVVVGGLAGNFLWSSLFGASSPWKEGGIYSIDNGNGSFGIVKILKLDPGIVHVRVYRNTFPFRPFAINTHELTLGRVDDPQGFGMGHLPMSEASFRSWNAALLAETAVSQEELEGYNMWKQAGGGVFG
jgi:hypothetical protein